MKIIQCQPKEAQNQILYNFSKSIEIHLQRNSKEMTSTQRSLKDLKVLTSIIKLQQQIESLVWYSRKKKENLN